MVILISMNKIKLWFLTFLASCNGFAIKISRPVIAVPQAVIIKAQRSAKILLMDALPFPDAYSSHQSRFRDAKL